MFIFTGRSSSIEGGGLVSACIYSLLSFLTSMLADIPDPTGAMPPPPDDHVSDAVSIFLSSYVPIVGLTSELLTEQTNQPLCFVFSHSFC